MWTLGIKSKTYEDHDKSTKIMKSKSWGSRPSNWNHDDQNDEFPTLKVESMNIMSINQDYEIEIIGIQTMTYQHQKLTTWKSNHQPRPLNWKKKGLKL